MRNGASEASIAGIFCLAFGKGSGEKATAKRQLWPPLKKQSAQVALPAAQLYSTAERCRSFGKASRSYQHLVSPRRFIFHDAVDFFFGAARVLHPARCTDVSLPSFHFRILPKILSFPPPVLIDARKPVESHVEVMLASGAQAVSCGTTTSTEQIGRACVRARFGVVHS